MNSLSSADDILVYQLCPKSISAVSCSSTLFRFYANFPSGCDVLERVLSCLDCLALDCIFVLGACEKQHRAFFLVVMNMI